MDLDNLTYPGGYSKPNKTKAEVFRTWLLWNQEICNECYTKVRNVGEELSVEGSIHTHTVNSYYERTEDGIQAHTAFELASDRFGTCFCNNCGSDLKSYKNNLSKDDLVERAKNIIKYVNHPKNDVPYHVDGGVMAQTINDLKTVADNQGFDTEILAVATIEAMFADRKV